MSIAIAFDALNYVKVLEDAGVSRSQAEAQAKAQQAFVVSVLDSHEHSVATKADLAALRSDLVNQIQIAQRDVIIRLGAMIVALGGILIAIKYFG